MSRDSADWLVANQEVVDWHSCRLTLHDDAGQEIVFPGRWADVRVSDQSASHTQASDSLPASIPVAVLVGSWWPHPARRQTGDVVFASRVWQSPDLADFGARERHQRLLYAAFLTFIGVVLLLTWVAYAHSTVLERAAATAGGVGSLVTAATLGFWHPRYR